MRLLILTALIFLTACATTPEGYDAQVHPPTSDQSNWVQDADGNHYFVPPPVSTPVEQDDETDRSAVQVQVTPQQATIGFDLLGLRNYRASEWARSAWGPLKVVSYPVDYLTYLATNHPAQTIGLGLLAWEAYDGTPSDTIGSLFNSSSSSSSDNQATSRNDSIANIDVDGSNNIVTVNVNNSTATTEEAPRTTNTQ
jgi:hypothetical protein